ncbi:lysophospholipid acyltransferase family protein [Tamlana sp. 62-3]|uniref:Lysophospholipid acyltransferase family protein n=1 Tax=Neotamlana sargassicola TaxID=2883125 RepID=A0A9X1I6E2_9FLAO|nr:lysophospholipid acyltransferase family protein [Tamlana sargassicola]MCB4808691.1 lysophospholipid acyltransferase family protein [Tamlana sargassicola]
MKNIWLYGVRAYLRLALFFYYKKIQVVNAKHIPKNKPVLLLSNHQNALIDALLIAVYGNGRFFYFLTRASVFNNPRIAKLLKSLQMIPVYRVRDGWSTISNNTKVFASCSRLLNNNEAVSLFPEGNHSLNRTVRPLSKGFTRIVFETLESYPETDLQIVPLGLNYKNAENYPDSVSLFFGKPISAKQFLLEDRRDGVLKLKTVLQNRLIELTTHIPKENYAESLAKLNDLNVDFLKPKTVNSLIKNNFLGEVTASKAKMIGLHKVFKSLLIILLIVPYFIWKFVVQPKIKEAEFIATFRFAVAITLVPLWAILMICVLAFVFNILIGASYLILVISLALLSSKI